MSELGSKHFNHPILIAGGAGYLGSHMVALCLEKQVDVVVIDNLSNSDLSNLKKLESHFKVTIPFFNIDICDQDKLKQFFNSFDVGLSFGGKHFNAKVIYAFFNIKLSPLCSDFSLLEISALYKHLYKKS